MLLFGYTGTFSLRNARFEVVLYNRTDLFFPSLLAQISLRPMRPVGFVKWTLSLQEHMFPSVTVILFSLAGAQV